ncbi:MAG: nucleotidyltransferase domain-containing protein [Ilumatobacteraceae bacterium]
MDLPGRSLVDGADALVDALRQAGARFAFVHGSRAAGTARPGSDLDVAAWFGVADPAPWDVVLPGDVDLLVLDRAPLELAGRVALQGALLFDDDPPARVAWQGDTRLQYLDETDFQRELADVFFRSRRGR